MPTLDVLDLDNKKVGSIDLDDRVWGAQPRRWLLTEIVHWQRAKRRAGTQKQKNKTEVNGTTKKPYKQKGTGNARQGDLKNPHMVGGGAAFAARPRDYSYSMPRHKRRAALATALSVKAKEGNLRVVKDFALGEFKTKKVTSALDALGTTSAVIVDGENEHLKKSAANLAGSRYLHTDGINVYDLLKYRTLVITESAAKQVTGRILSEDPAQES
jgi:large subunit ribosomal protein L4